MKDGLLEDAMDEFIIQLSDSESDSEEKAAMENEESDSDCPSDDKYEIKGT